MHTILSSATKTVRIGDDQPFAIIGERINPTGRKIFQQQLRQGDVVAFPRGKEGAHSATTRTAPVRVGRVRVPPTHRANSRLCVRCRSPPRRVDDTWR